MEPVDVDDLAWEDIDPERMGIRRKQLSTAAGGEQLGGTLYEVPPGAESWPYHYHAANEEALYVLSGSGTVRIAGGPRPLSTGDYLSFPAGEDGAHKVTNDSETPLRYLMFSTMHEPDITVYPDSRKLGVFAGAAPGSREERTIHRYYRLEDDVDYWEGE